jgi:hypothetical protein
MKIDNQSLKKTNSLLDEMLKKQPFYYEVLFSYQIDVSTEELEELIKIYLIIWLYFRTNKNVQTRIVTVNYFENVQKKHIEMLKFIDGEKSQKNIIDVYSNDLQNLKSKALFTAVFYRYNSTPVLLKMDSQIKGIILIGIKSFIECFETI